MSDESDSPDPLHSWPITLEVVSDPWPVWRLRFHRSFHKVTGPMTHVDGSSPAEVFREAFKILQATADQGLGVEMIRRAERAAQPYDPEMLDVEWEDDDDSTMKHRVQIDHLAFREIAKAAADRGWVRTP